MTKYNQLPQVEHMYIYERKSLAEIGALFGLSRRILFYWKKKYNWDKKRFEMDYEKENFSKELLEFARKIMNKVSKGLVLALAGITVGTSTGLSTTFFQSTSVAYAAEMTKEKNDLANRYIADYLGNCQQYEQNDKTFKGFSSIKDITYSRDNKIKIDVSL